MKVRLTVFALLAITGPPAIAAAAIVDHHTAAGTALAREALLVRGDLGSGWSTSAAPRSVPPLTCPAFSPLLDGVVERGAAASPTFSEGRGGPFVSQASYVYATASQAAAVWRRVVTPDLLRCVAASLRGGGGSSGVAFAVTSERQLTGPALAARHAGYRVAGTASSPGQTIDVYVDVFVLRAGDALTQISVSSFAKPPSRRLELRVSRAVARRLGAG